MKTIKFSDDQSSVNGLYGSIEKKFFIPNFILILLFQIHICYFFFHLNSIAEGGVMAKMLGGRKFMPLSDNETTIMIMKYTINIIF